MGHVAGQNVDKLKGEKIMFKKIKKFIFIAFLFFASIFVAMAGGNKEQGKFSGNYALGGSTTVEPIALAAIDYLEEKYEGLNLSYDSQGSSVGIQGVIEEVYILGGASRELKEKEKKEGAKAVPVALDGVAVIVNKETINISNLTLEQVTDIYSGKISNWKEVGGPNKDIVVFNRDEASGTRSCFKDSTVKKFKTEFIDNVAIVSSNGDMVSKVGSTPFSIGYCGFGYIEKDPGTKALLINKIEPETKNVLNNSYLISRKLNIIYMGELIGFKEVFINFLLSEEGQSIVEEENFIPIQ